jgi:hypothetical protein
MAAFLELSSARPYIGMGGAAGPIPFGALAEYARLRGWADPVVYDRFAYLVRALDAAYIRRANASLAEGKKAPTHQGRAGEKRR